MQLVIALIVGCVMGLLAGILGIGGGVIAIPAMIYLLKMPTHLAMGTSLAVIIPLALTGTYKHLMNHNVDIRVAVALAIGGIVFAYIGAWLQPRIPDLMLKRIFGAFIIILGINLVLSRPKAPAPEPVGVGEKTVESRM